MQLNVFRTLWGVTTPWQQTVSELQSVGCCGIEARVPLTVEEQRTLAQRLQASALEYIAIVFSGGGVIPAQAETPAQHLERLKERFAAAKRSTRASSICWPATTAGRWRSRWIFSAGARAGRRV
jgi:hypothetical protein